MTLHAHIELPLTRQTSRIDDCAANGFRRGLAARGFDMGAARSVAALAIDAFGQFRREYSFVGGR
jgi:hypothetical protein